MSYERDLGRIARFLIKLNEENLIESQKEKIIAKVKNLVERNNLDFSKISDYKTLVKLIRGIQDLQIRTQYDEKMIRRMERDEYFVLYGGTILIKGFGIIRMHTTLLYLRAMYLKEFVKSIVNFKIFGFYKYFESMVNVWNEVRMVKGLTAAALHAGKSEGELINEYVNERDSGKSI